MFNYVKPSVLCEADHTTNHQGLLPQKTPIATKLHVIPQCVCMPHRTLDAKDNEQNRTHLPPQKCPRSCNSVQYDINMGKNMGNPMGKP